MKYLHFAEGMNLPLDAVTQKFAYVGRTGSGKSYGASKTAEEMLEHDAQVVVLDPVGPWAGLRLAGDGAAARGFEIPVFGGLNGDIPLESGAGAMIADLIADRAISAVLDVSQMLSSEQARFATDFATRFFQRKKAAPSAVHLFLEECQEFVPQNAQPGEQRMLHAFERLVKLGRNFGIGVSLISQRPQEVNKKALNQTECLFAFQMTGPQERKAMVAWMSDKGMQTDVADTLPGLEVGECLVWSPSWLRVNKRVRVLPKRSADASSTPKVGAKARIARPLTPIDLDAIRRAMAATIERAKADDPKELRRRISELEKQVAAKAPAAAQVERVTRIEVPVLTEHERTVLTDVSRTLAEMQSQMLDLWRSVMARAPKANGAAGEYFRPGLRVVASSGDGQVAAPVAKSTASRARNISPKPAQPAGENGSKLGGGGARRMLAVLAAYGRCSRSKVGLLAGLAWRGGTFEKYLGILKKEVHVTEGAGALEITASGRAVVGNVTAPPVGPEAVDYWVAELGKGKGGGVLRALADLGGVAPREDVIRRAELTEGGTFQKYLGILKKVGLVEGTTDLQIAEALR